MNVEYIASLMAQRQPAYQQAADLTVSTDGKTPAEISRKWLGAAGAAAALNVA